MQRSSQRSGRGSGANKLPIVLTAISQHVESVIDNHSFDVHKEALSMLDETYNKYGKFIGSFRLSTVPLLDLRANLRSALASHTFTDIRAGVLQPKQQEVVALAVNYTYRMLCNMTTTPFQLPVNLQHHHRQEQPIGTLPPYPKPPPMIDISPYAPVMPDANVPSFPFPSPAVSPPAQQHVIQYRNEASSVEPKRTVKRTREDNGLDRRYNGGEPYRNQSHQFRRRNFD